MGTEEMAHVSCLLCMKRTWFCILGTHVKVRYSGMCGNRSRGRTETGESLELIGLQVYGTDGLQDQ